MWQEIFGIGFIGSALLNCLAINQNRKLSIENRLFSRLQAQINNLYAPLYHLVLENENTLKLYDKYHEEYDKRFIQTRWSNDKETHEYINKESSAIIKMGNDLINNFVTTNNEEIIKIIKQNAAYIDNDDQNIFVEFTQHSQRLKTEFEKNGKLKFSLPIYENLGNVSYFLPAFAEKVKEKYGKKIGRFNLLLKK